MGYIKFFFNKILAHSFFLIIAFTTAYNLILLQVHRPIPADEVINAESAFSIYDGALISKITIWSHIFPEAGIINFNYPPLYFYVLGFWMKIIGFSPIATGLLHLVIRIISIILLHGILKKVNLPKWVNLAICLWWASFSPFAFYSGRPDDLALIPALLAVYLCINLPQKPKKILTLSGILLAVSFLTYPVALFIGILLCALALLRQNQLKFNFLFRLLFFAAIGSSLWLIWIIPYATEFRNYFLNFVIPDAHTQKYATEVFRHLQSLTIGINSIDKKFRFLTSTLPPVMLLTAVAMERSAKLTFFQIAGIFILLCMIFFIAQNRIHAYAVGWLAVLLLITLSFIIPGNNKSTSLTPRLSFLFIIVILPSLSLLGLKIINLIGNLSYQHNCASNHIIAEIRNSIPAGEKVISGDGLPMYILRDKNSIYWPASLSGKTPGGVAYSAQYDDSFTWLVTNQPLDINSNLGSKFSWNKQDQQYFLSHYVLVKVIQTPTACFSISVSRFSTVQSVVYIYRRE